MSNKWTLTACLLAGFALTACDEEPPVPEIKTNCAEGQTTFACLCEASGGTYKDEHTCICSNEECTADNVCNYVTKTCPVPPSQDGVSFAEACAKTGGTAEGNYCICDGKRGRENETCVPQITCGEPSFSEACVKTGGTVVDEKYCECNGIKGKEYETCSVDPSFAEACVKTDGTVVDERYCECNDGKKGKEYETCGNSHCLDCPPCETLTYAEACNKTGGTVVDEIYCECNGEKGNEYETCTPPTPPPETTTFAKACEASGGAVVNDRCVCDNKVCDSGAICDFNEPHECTYAMCIAESPLCLNDDTTFIGTVTSYNEANEKEDKVCKGDVSCKDHEKCGECLNYRHVCNNDPNTGFGTVQECQNGKPGVFVESCKDANDKGVSCRMQYALLRDANGDPILDKDGFASYEVDEEASNKKGYTVYKLEPLNVCGECKDDEVKCENDLSDNAVMYRCVGGVWRQIYDYQDPASLTHSSAIDNGVITIQGYRPSTQKVESYKISLRSRSSEHAVSCNADGTWYGVCHNSVQVCINRTRGKNGYIIKCQNGALAHYDSTESLSYIACNCQNSNNNDGGCSSSRNCYAAQTASSGMEMCKPATYNSDGEAPEE